MILITGGTGLLGSYLIAAFSLKGIKPKAVKRPGSDLSNCKKIFSEYGSSALPFEEAVEWIEGDVLDPYFLEEAMDGVEQVYHCAALVSFNPKDRDLMFKVNATGTSNVMNAALEKSIKKVCHVSSVAALGKPPHVEIITEENWWKTSPANSSYAVTKYSAEREAWRAAEEGLNVVIVNPSIILGAGDWKRGSAAIFNEAYKGMKFFSSGVSGFVDARDVVKCMIGLMEGNFQKERFIISSENMPFRELFNLMHDEFGKSRPMIRAGKILTGITWRAEAIRSKLTGIPPLITKETVQSAQSNIFFSNEKIRKALNIEFIPPGDSIKEICKIFLKERSTRV